MTDASPSLQDQMQELRARLLTEHDTPVDADDPILAAALLNERIIQEAAKRLDAQADAVAEKIAETLAAGSDSAKATGARVINDAADYVSEEVRFAVKDELQRLREAGHAPLEDTRALAEAGVAAWRKAEGWFRLSLVLFGINLLLWLVVCGILLGIIGGQ